MNNLKPDHELKSINPFFTDVWEGRKTFELRYNDRNYKVDDILWLDEYLPNIIGQTGRYLRRRIVVKVTYLVTHHDISALSENWVCMSISVLERFNLDSFC